MTLSLQVLGDTYCAGFHSVQMLRDLELVRDLLWKSLSSDTVLLFLACH